VRVVLAALLFLLTACGREPTAPVHDNGPCVLDAYWRDIVILRLHYLACPSDSAIAAHHLVREP
jgi:hypothetical protein